MRSLLFLLIVISLAAIGWADTLVLRDGTRLVGDVKKTDAGYEITGADGKVTKVSASQVQSIELGAGTGASGGSATGAGAGATTNMSSDAASALAALKSLRRSVEALPEINQILERYQRFIDNTKDSKIVEEARKDLAMWKERQSRGMVKHGSKWMTAEQAAEMIAKANATAQEARELLRAGKQTEADAAIGTALDQDPTNPAALFLRGIVLYRADKLIDARKAFETVNTQVDKHAPTLNNLAVIHGRQKQPGPALNLYDQAMQAAPVNKFILDNVADALGTMPENDRKGAQYQRVARRFAEQDQLLQKQMAPQGWYRWGSQWVDQKALDQLKEAEKAVRAKMAAMQSDFDQSKARIAQIDQEVAQNTRQMDDLRSRSLYYDPITKRTVTYPLPQAYYDLQNKNQSLRQEQSALNAKLNTLKEQASHIQQELPTPRFTGIQQIVGVEGMPMGTPPSASDDASTQPATMPK
jgi:Flp pilus assembly protein TadD